MGNNMIKKFRWWWAWQDEAEEQWLGEMSAKGIHLVSPGFPGTYTFDIGEPKEYVYRLDYQNFYKKDREEYLQLFRDSGWEYLGQLASWQYFRKDKRKGGATEIFTDNESKIAKYRRVITFVGLFYLTLGLILWSRLVAYNASDGTGIIIWLISIMLIFFSYAIFRIFLRIRKLQKR